MRTGKQFSQILGLLRASICNSHFPRLESAYMRRRQQGEQYRLITIVIWTSSPEFPRLFTCSKAPLPLPFSTQHSTTLPQASTPTSFFAFTTSSTLVLKSTQNCWNIFSTGKIFINQKLSRIGTSSFTNVVPPALMVLSSKRNVCSPESTYSKSPRQRNWVGVFSCLFVSLVGWKAVVLVFGCLKTCSFVCLQAGVETTGVNVQAH